MKIIRWGAVLGAVAALALAGTAHAQDETPDVPYTTVETDGCDVKLWLNWEHDNTDQWESNGWQVYLIVQAGDEVDVVSTHGGQVYAGPYDLTEVEVSYQQFGGPERDYDYPAVADVDDLVAHFDGGGTVADYTGWQWEPVAVEGCEVPEPDPSPSATPSEPPAEETEPPAGGEGGDGEELAQTGVPTAGLAAGAAAVVALGAGLMWASRRRRASFTA